MNDNPIAEMFGRAARGDAEAQGYMAVAALHYGGYTPEVALAICDMWSRMAAMQGRWDDLARVIMCRTIAAERHLKADRVEQAVEEVAEALLIVSRIDEQGDPRATDCLYRLIMAAKEDDVLNPALARAKEMEREYGL